MKVKLKERTPECKKAYFDGYSAACMILRHQMLDKMHYYRSLLEEYRSAINHYAFPNLSDKITKELSLNPEFEVLDHMPHAKFVHGPDAYKAFNTGPEPK